MYLLFPIHNKIAIVIDAAIQFFFMEFFITYNFQIIYCVDSTQCMYIEMSLCTYYVYDFEVKILYEIYKKKNIFEIQNHNHLRFCSSNKLN